MTTAIGLLVNHLPPNTTGEHIATRTATGHAKRLRPFPFRCVPLAHDSAALQTPKTLPRQPGDSPRRLNRFASSDDPTFPKAASSCRPQTAPCFARHDFCSPPPRLFRVRLPTASEVMRGGLAASGLWREEKRSSERSDGSAIRSRNAGFQTKDSRRGAVSLRAVRKRNASPENVRAVRRELAYGEKHVEARLRVLSSGEPENRNMSWL